MSLALDIDTVKHAIGAWERRKLEAGLAAREIALAMAAEHLAAGHDVIMGQYLAVDMFIVKVKAVAERVGAEWREIVLSIDAETLSQRLQGRHDFPDRAEHAINNNLASLEDVPRFIDSMEDLLRRRSTAVRVDASGDPHQTFHLVESALFAGGDHGSSH